MDPLQPTIEVTDDGVEVYGSEPQEDTSLIELIPLQGLLGIDEPGARQRTQLKAIWDFFGEGAQGVADLLYKVKQTEMKMSPPRLGETRLTKLHSYVALQAQTKDLESRLAQL